jgi:hypothetical protein
MTQGSSATTARTGSAISITSFASEPARPRASTTASASSTAGSWLPARSASTSSLASHTGRPTTGRFQRPRRAGEPPRLDLGRPLSISQACAPRRGPTRSAKTAVMYERSSTTRVCATASRRRCDRELRRHRDRRKRSAALPRTVLVGRRAIVREVPQRRRRSPPRSWSSHAVRSVVVGSTGDGAYRSDGAVAVDYLITRRSGRRDVVRFWRSSDWGVCFKPERAAGIRRDAQVAAFPVCLAQGRSAAGWAN